MRKRSIDWYTLIPVILLLCVGIIMVLSASSPTAALGKSGDEYSIFKKQLRWIVLGFIAMYIAANYNYRKLGKLVIPSLVISIVLLLAVFNFDARKGAISWIEIGGYQFQPSEFVKLCLILILSKIMSTNKDKMRSFGEGLLPPIIVVGIICVLVVLQRDLGTAIVIAITSFILMFVGGANIRHLIGLAAVGIGAAAWAILAKAYRMARIMSFIDPSKDPRGDGFQITQSLYAIGSGGLLGVGLGRSLQKFRWIPEQHTDFIFAILAEELGFIGGTFVILLFVILCARGYLIAKNCRDTFGSLMAAGITTMIMVEALINIAVVSGSMPVTGITLPFISYGGSSLIFKMTAIGVLLNISRYSALEKSEGAYVQQYQ